VNARPRSSATEPDDGPDTRIPSPETPNRFRSSKNADAHGASDIATATPQTPPLPSKPGNASNSSAADDDAAAAARTGLRILLVTVCTVRGVVVTRS
jgi:hypothetical protein